MKSSFYRVLLLVLPALLAACVDKPPEEADFLSNAQQQLQIHSPQAPCLPLPTSADHESIRGGLPNGWVAFLKTPSASEGGSSRRDAQPKFEALMKAGLIQKEDYWLAQGGELKPASRYFLTDAGRKAASGTASPNCLLIGHWSARKLVLPRSGVKSVVTDPQLIQKKVEGDNVTYEGWVSFELDGTPDWVATPALAGAFDQLVQFQAGKVIKVELVRFNKEWVSRQVLSRRMANGSPEASEGTDKPGRTAVEIPAELHAVALAKLNGEGGQSFAARQFRLALPLNSASETPVAFALPHPGSVFFATTPDPLAPSRSRVELQLAMLAEREKSEASLPPAMRSSNREAINKERVALAAMPSVHGDGSKAAKAADRFLNSRAELQELLDVLVEAGAYTKKTVTQAEVPGAQQGGTLYSPTSSAQLQGSTLQFGTPRYTRIVKQHVAGSLLFVTVEYEIDAKPEWLDAVAKKLPMLAAKAGTRVVMARPVSNQEFPYSFGY